MQEKQTEGEGRKDVNTLRNRALGLGQFSVFPKAAILACAVFTGSLFFTSLVTNFHPLMPAKKIICRNYLWILSFPSTV